ncbi:MAG TPA: glycosyltransferase, partial [Candidatus Aquilonibacter sp.]|nr:glycosyltransferase [Candidatus Aquilonibacter sp.]
HYRSVPDRYVVDGVPVRTLRGLMGPASFGIGTLGLQLRAQLASIERSVRPDVVHVHGLLPAGALALATERPLVVTAHGSETYDLPWRRSGLEELARAVVRRADRIAAVSLFVASHLERLGARDVAIVPNGADEDLFRPLDRRASREALGIDTDRPLVLFVGHQERDKGVVELMEALRQLRSLNAGVVFAGKGSLRPWLERELREAGIPAWFLGPLDHERLALAYGACTVFTLPSYREGLPTVICEAMNAGRAVVATSVGGIPEQVHDGVTGRLVAPGDAGALAAALRDVLTSDDERVAMERAARESALERFTWRANARAYEALYAAAEKKIPTLA